MLSGLLALSLLLASPLPAWSSPHGLLPLDGEAEILRGQASGSRWTFYDVGLGACGQNNVGSDFVVALNGIQYGTGAHCMKQIVMTYNGKSTNATIVDKCPGCPRGGLDLSNELFEFFAPLSNGVIQGSWNVVDN
ncbi:hypothetical protein DXG01_001352 [Tephrocybe rancida]|nr:hypothetical protein DXG01_001352 [Tephrocybe rancida]